MSIQTITRATGATAVAALSMIGSFEVAGADRAVGDDRATDTIADRSSPAPLFEFGSAPTVEINPDARVDIIGEMTIDPPPADPGLAVGDIVTGNPNGNGAQFHAAEDYKAGAGCSVSCITSGVAYQHGPDARLRVTTDYPAQIWIIVWDDHGYHRMEQSQAADATAFQAVFDDVDLDSTYYAMAVAQDSDGFSDHADGEFTTGARHVEIDFGAVNAYTLPDGAHSMISAAYVDGVSESVGSLPVSTTRHDVGRYLDLMGQAGIEVPPADPGPCEAFGLHFELPHYYVGPCHMIASVHGDDIDLDDRPANAGSGSHTIETTLVHPGGQALPPGYGQQFQFDVPVELTVWYG